MRRVVPDTNTYSRRLRCMAALMIGSALAFTVMSQTARADALHGYCGTGPTTTCADNNTNSPDATNPPTFFFADSGGSASGDLRIVFLIPSGDTQPSSVTLTGAAPGTATLFSSIPWSTGKLGDYLGLTGASPTNPIGNYAAGGSSYDVYVADLGQETISGTGSPFTGALEDTSSSLPLDSYILAFLNTSAPGATPNWVATANSGAILEIAPPPPVPEPSSLMLLGTGALGLAGVVRRRFGR